MLKTDDRKQGRGAAWKGLAFGCAAGYAVLFIFIAIAALMISKEKIPESGMNAVVTVSSAFGAFVSGILSSKILGRRGMLMGVGAAAVMIIVRTLAGLALHGAGAFGPATLGIFGAMLAGGVVGGVLNIKKRKTRRSR